jgi:hypothetical protein
MRSVLAVALALAALSRDARADPALADYRTFRHLAIDLLGRPPTRAELAAFARPGFDLGAWIDAGLAGPGYAERIRQIYADLLKLDLPEGANPFAPPSVVLRWTQIQGPDGRMIDLYFRDGQRRKRAAIDGQVCFTPAETGLQAGADGPPTGTPRPVDRALLDERTVVIKPWWLYADHRDRDPHDRAGPDWIRRFGYELAWPLFSEPDGKTAMTGVRVCREEAQTAETGRVYASGRVVQKSDPLLPGRLTRLPADTPFARANAGRPVSCRSPAGFESSLDCGCGVGLERCLPAAPAGFVQPWLVPLGVDQPFDRAARPAALWLRTWWSQEAVHFLDRIFGGDRDVREVLTSPATTINGPLAQFYRFLVGATCCGDGAELGYREAEPLFDPAAVPANLLPHQVSTWTTVDRRGPHAAGVMTMPIFLLKYPTRRQRAHAIYSAFLCRDFVAEPAQLAPSDEPDLTRRPGCATCHRRLEPLAAYFARIRESDWTYLPAAQFPVAQPRCASGDPARMAGACRTFYDPAFTDARSAELRGAHGDPAHVEAGPRGLAAEITASPLFAPCVVQNVAQGLLGRALTPDDEAWKAGLAGQLVANGYRVRPLVRAIVTSPRYRDRAGALPEPGASGTASAPGTPAAPSASSVLPGHPVAGVAPSPAPPAPSARSGHPTAGTASAPGTPAAPSAPSVPPGHPVAGVAPSPAPRAQVVPAEAMLRAYLTWFGGLTPEQVVQRAHGNNLFDAWSYYLPALGLPDHHVDAPRVSQSSTVLLAALGRLGEALCAYAAEHDLHDHPALPARAVFAFEPVAGPSRDPFATGFDVLHQTFLGYPARLAPADRIDRFHALYRQVAARHPRGRLTAEETAWAAVCTALVQHPEAELY